MTLEQQILVAVVLDLILGDPRWLPHPVRGIAWLAAAGVAFAAPRPIGRLACGGDGVCRRRRRGLGRDPADCIGLACACRRRFHRPYLHEPCRPGPGPAQHGRLPAPGRRRPGRSSPPRGVHRRTRHGGLGRIGRGPGDRGKRRRKHRRWRRRAAVLRLARRAGRGNGLSGDQHAWIRCSAIATSATPASAGRPPAATTWPTSSLRG